MRKLTMTIARALPFGLAVITLTAVSAADPTAGGSASPSNRPWLEVKLPPPPGAGAPAARATFVLHDDSAKAADWAGFRISIGGAAPRELPTGQRGEFAVAASATEPLRI